MDEKTALKQIRAMIAERDERIQNGTLKVLPNSSYLPRSSREKLEAVFLVRCLLDGATLATWAEGLSPVDFTLKLHRELFAVLSDLTSLDLVTISTALRAQDRIDLLSYFVSLLETFPTQDTSEIWVLPLVELGHKIRATTPQVQ